MFPSLPGGMDRVLRTYFDGFRSKGTLPPYLVGRIDGKLAETLPKTLKFYDEKLETELSGRLDELISLNDGTFSAFDFKTRGVAPKEGMIPAYQNQMDIYTYLLENNGFKTNGTAYLAYYFPNDVNKMDFNFNLEIKEVKADVENAKKIFADAVDLLRKGKMPPMNYKCPYCLYKDQRTKVEQ